MKLKEQERKALSGGELVKFLGGKTRVIKYSDLSKIHDINEVLFGFNSCIILILSKKNFGHWVCLTRRNDELEFFDSYGYTIDDPVYFKLNNKYFRKVNNQDYPHLTYLLMKTPYKLMYNEIKFQKKNPNIATCGRHVACRIMYKHLNLYQYKDILDYYKEKYEKKYEKKYDYDEIVTILTQKM